MAHRPQTVPPSATSRKEGQGGNSGEWPRVGERSEPDCQRPEATRPRRTKRSAGTADGWERSPKRQRRGHAAIKNQYSLYPVIIRVQWYWCIGCMERGGCWQSGSSNEACEMRRARRASGGDCPEVWTAEVGQNERV